MHPSHELSSNFLTSEVEAWIRNGDPGGSAGGPVTLQTIGGFGVLVAALAYPLQAVIVLPGDIDGIVIAATVAVSVLIALTGRVYGR